jgi:hypothetical protein
VVEVAVTTIILSDASIKSSRKDGLGRSNSASIPPVGWPGNQAGKLAVSYTRSDYRAHHEKCGRAILNLAVTPLASLSELAQISDIPAA